jgi:DUF4097 and DUF4098 domain-containing protein YvlB
MRRSAQAVSLTLLAGAFVLGCGESTGPGELTDEWSGQIAQGDELEIKGINGSIEVTLASGSTAEVSAFKRSDANDPDSVTVEVVEHAGGVTICAVYPDVPGQPANECLPGEQGHMSVQNNDVEVNFTVLLPAGVVFTGNTINGAVTADDLLSNAFLETINGDVRVSTTQLALAATVNGSVDATVGLTTWDRDLAFASVNGNVTVEVPAATNAVVRAATASGSISSEFTEVVEVGPGDWRGTLGSGGRLLTIATVNGNVALREGP